MGPVISSTRAIDLPSPPPPPKPNPVGKSTSVRFREDARTAKRATWSAQTTQARAQGLLKIVKAAMSQPTHTTSKKLGNASGQATQSEMMKDYLANNSTVVGRLVSGTTVSDGEIRDILRQKAARLDEMVKQAQVPASKSTKM
ncbi:hypothetical protein DL767_004917 [Monosporascus sp. MG133]|nr:hypothetical protein DL767_004917 [Monosporascus sp. MG133]